MVNHEHRELMLTGTDKLMTMYSFVRLNILPQCFCKCSFAVNLSHTVLLVLL